MERYLLENLIVKEKLSPGTEKALKKRWRVASTCSLCAIRILNDYRKASAKRRANQIIIERIFVVTNFVLEVPSAVFDQLSSNHKNQYLLAAMLMSLATLLICITELVYQALKARVAWKWRQKIIPWFYYSSPGNRHRPFGSVTDIIGLLSAIFQCIFTTITYVLYRQGSKCPVQISIMPLVFAFCVLCSKFQKNSEESSAYYSGEVRH
ncbi:hypothetical protein Pint_17474 [Pistacia integerrima]|uniref:Uncharacterized protein n=1 Tax=Pistacia integerrima TaxID=434235 RepID=A0ACC0YVL3_9ROSI|nr:hypothetical protein Pint_17474 [Pistacia integerrima]